MSDIQDWVRYETRRQFFSRGANAVGAAALASLIGNGRGTAAAATTSTGGHPPLTHFAPKAIR